MLGGVGEQRRAAASRVGWASQGAVQGEVLVVAIDRLAVEQGAQHLGERGEPSFAHPRWLEGNAGGGELGRCVPGAETDLHATAGQMVERCDLASEHQRMV